MILTHKLLLSILINININLKTNGFQKVCDSFCIPFDFLNKIPHLMVPIIDLNLTNVTPILFTMRRRKGRRRVADKKYDISIIGRAF